MPLMAFLKAPSALNKVLFLQAFQLYLQLMSILATLNVQWPHILGSLFSASGYLTNVAPQVQVFVYLACCLCTYSSMLEYTLFNLAQFHTDGDVAGVPHTTLTPPV